MSPWGAECLEGIVNGLGNSSGFEQRFINLRISRRESNDRYLGHASGTKPCFVRRIEGVATSSAARSELEVCNHFSLF